MKSLVRNINIGNILLAAAVALFVFSDVSPFFTIRANSALPSAKKQEQETVGEAQEIQIQSPAEFMSVAEQNLFHPERKIPVEKKAEQLLPKPDFVLYGTMITDGLSLAYVEDLKAPRSSPGRGKRQIALRKGDALSGFILKEIESSHIVLVRGEEKVMVSLSDPSHLKERSVSGVEQSTSASPPASVPGTQSPQQSDRRLPRTAIQQSSPPSPQVVPSRSERRRDSQKILRPQTPGN